MKSYVKPVVIENNEIMEGIYVASGFYEEPSADYVLIWSGHNSGSHSSLEFNVDTRTKWQHIHAVITYIGEGGITYKEEDIQGPGGFERNISDRSVTLDLQNHQDYEHSSTSEHFHFSVSNVIFDCRKPGYEFDGKTGGSRYPTDVKRNESALDDFEVYLQIT